MSQYLTTARPHAKALFDHAEKHDQLSLWLDALLVLRALSLSKDFIQRARDPGLHHEEVLRFIVSVVQACVQEAKTLAPALTAYVRLLIESDRLVISADVHTLYLSMLSEKERTRHVNVVSAYVLSEAQLGRIKQALEGQFGCSVSMSCTQDRELIGGVKLVSGSWVLDGSIENRLNNLRDCLRNLM